jgi:hypothetical protein
MSESENPTDFIILGDETQWSAVSELLSWAESLSDADELPDDRAGE